MSHIISITAGIMGASYHEVMFVLDGVQYKLRIASDQFSDLGPRKFELSLVLAQFSVDLQGAEIPVNYSVPSLISRTS